jgi:hypothetical protein
MPGKLNYTYTLPKGLTELSERFPKAANAVLNRTGAEARTKWAQFIAEEFNVSPARLKERISVVKSSWQTLVFMVKVRGKKFPIIDFVVNGKRPTARKGVHPTAQRPVVVEIVKGKRTTLNESPFSGATGGGKAFIMQSNNKLQVRRRTGMFNIQSHKENTTLWRYIHPIIFFKNKNVWERVSEFTQERLIKELPRVIKAFVESGREP